MSNLMAQQSSQSPLTVSGGTGYNVTVFEGKNDQMLAVCSIIEEKGFIPKELVKNEVAWFYGYLYSN
jgi:glutamate dehydrogenase